MVKQFNFNKSYAEIIGGLSHTEAGAYIKKICEFMFRDTDLDALATDKVGSLLLLASESLQEEKEVSARGITIRKERHFAFKSTYANLFFILKDSEAGILIKQICQFMFGGEMLSEEDAKVVGGYFTAIKKPLLMSKRQAENARKKVRGPIASTKITLESIKTEFNLSGNLREDNPILNGVVLEDFRDYLQKTPAMQNGNLYRTIEKYREERMKKY